MSTSHAIAVPGLRTGVATGWRSDDAAIAATLRAHPRLLVPGMIGFALRGGIVFLTVPILVLPTSVEARLLLGGNLSSTGLTSGFYLILGALSAISLAIALLALYAIARCELASFARHVNAAQRSAQHVWQPPGRLSDEQHRAATSRVFVVQTLGLLAILLAAVPLAAAVGQATLSEILLPSSADSMYSRIINDVTAPLVEWVAAVVAIEALSAIATRRALAGVFGLKVHFRITHHPLRVLVVALVGWALFSAAVGVAVVALSVTWTAVQSVYLSTGFSGGLREIVSALIVAVLFGAVFAASLLLCGLVSSIRAGLWTLASLR